jgi:hypothetical protein
MSTAIFEGLMTGKPRDRKPRDRRDVPRFLHR